jgi:hypothetical protein
MDWFDDIQVEDFSNFDFVDEMNEALFEKEDNDKNFDKFLKSDFDF